MSCLSFGPIRLTDPRSGCPVVVAAGRARAASASDLAPPFVSGWGSTFEEAALGCEHEAEEAFYSQIVSAGRIVKTSAEALGREVVAPPDLVHFSDEQYAGRSAWNRACDERHRVCAPWHPGRRLDWIAARADYASRAAWLPARYCVMGYSRDVRSGLPPADSNGLARGETIEDSAVRGFLEIVERDATAIWWHNRLAPPRLDPASIADGLVDGYRRWLRARGRELRLLWLTLDLAVPVVAALAFDADGGQPALGIAAGRSQDEAARRAVGELAQCEENLVLMKERSRRAGTRGFSGAAQRLLAWHRSANADADGRLAGGGRRRAVIHRAADDWASCREICDKAGLDLLLVDLTSDPAFPLVRVVSPTLRSTRPRFGAGRLWDVPRRLRCQIAPPGSFDPTPFPA